MGIGGERKLLKMPTRQDTGIDLQIERMLSGDKLALAKVITIVENQSELTPAIMSKIYPHTGKSYQIGFTGPPGAGKSTLVDRIIPLFRERNYSLGIVAVDPSSPFSGGAVLGDRIRMQQHCLDDGVFIRSLGTRGDQGGLSRTTKGIIQLFDASGKDFVFIETVGVGQTELSVRDIADTTIVVLVPESGDAIQTMKAGLMEIADIFVVNKSDRDGAEAILTELRLMTHLGEKKGGWEIPILLTQASKDVGIAELFQQIERHRAFLQESKELSQVRIEQRQRELVEILVNEFERRLLDLAKKDYLGKYFEEMEKSGLSPYDVAAQIFRNKELLSWLFDKKR